MTFTASYQDIPALSIWWLSPFVVRVTALRRADVFAFEPGPASRKHGPTPERCPRQEPLGRKSPTTYALYHRASGPFRAPSALPSQWTQGREMDEWRSVRTKPAARVFVVAILELRTKVGELARALMAAETSGISTYLYQTPVQLRCNGILYKLTLVPQSGWPLPR